MSLYDVEVQLRDGATTTVASWAGHVLLIGPDGEGFGQLFSDFCMRGFFALGISSDNSPADAEYPQLSTDNAALFDALGTNNGAHGLWVVDDTGNVVGAFPAETDPEDDAVVDLIEQHLPV